MNQTYDLSHREDKHASLVDWLLAFWSDRMMAYHHATDEIWSHLHPEYIDHELDLTPKAEAVLCNA